MQLSMAKQKIKHSIRKIILGHLFKMITLNKFCFSANIEFLQPLQTKLKQLDAEIEDKRDKINDLRIVVFKNYYRIEKLLSSGNVQ